MPYSDFAILYRTNPCPYFWGGVEKRNIPYRVYGSISFTSVKRSKSWYRTCGYWLIQVMTKRWSVLLIIRKGNRQNTLEKLEEICKRKGFKYLEVIHELNEHQEHFNRGTISKLVAFRDFIHENQQKVTQLDAHEIAVHMASAVEYIKTCTMAMHLKNAVNLKPRSPVKWYKRFYRYRAWKKESQLIFPNTWKVFYYLPMPIPIKMRIKKGWVLWPFTQRRDWNLSMFI
jgi:superfamily I DNA/RNA helicase